MKPMTDPEKIKSNKYLDILAMVWITFLIVSTFTVQKVFSLGPFSFSVATLCYPITYIFADIFTEVYGYKKTRRIIWSGFVCLLLATSVASLYALVPPDPSYPDDAAFRSIFLASPIVALSGICGFFAGEFLNSYVVAKLKVYFNGTRMWVRLISSTLAGQTADNVIVYTLILVFAGYFSWGDLPNLIFSTVLFCTLWEVAALPLTYKIISTLKKAEQIDVYDRKTDFNPFKL